MVAQHDRTLRQARGQQRREQTRERFRLRRIVRTDIGVREHGRAAVVPRPFGQRARDVAEMEQLGRRDRTRIGLHFAVEDVDGMAGCEPRAQMVVGPPVAEPEFENRAGRQTRARAVEQIALRREPRDDLVEAAHPFLFDSAARSC